MKLTARVRGIKPSPTLSMAAEAAALIAEGRDIVDLSAGEPDFDTPEHVKAAAREALAQGKTKYTAVGGTPALKDAIREKLRRDNALTYERSEVMASCGEARALQRVPGAVRGGGRGRRPGAVLSELHRHVAARRRHSRIVETSPEQDFRMSASA